MSSKLLAVTLAAGSLMFGASIPADDPLQEEVNQSGGALRTSLFDLLINRHKSNGNGMIASSDGSSGCPGPGCFATLSENAGSSTLAMDDRQFFPSAVNSRYSYNLVAAAARLISDDIVTRLEARGSNGN